jgi:hypothetical protein
MSKKNKGIVGLVVGLVIFFTGWAIRSTFIVPENLNKPVGGIVIAIGMSITGYFTYKLLKR